LILDFQWFSLNTTTIPALKRISTVVFSEARHVQDDSQELQKVPNELEASRSSRKRAWENLQELRWVLLDSAGMKLPPPAKKTTDLKGKADQRGTSEKPSGSGQNALHELLNAINRHWKLSDSTVDAPGIGLIARGAWN
jgi:hypothetical protein